MVFWGHGPAPNPAPPPKCDICNKVSSLSATLNTVDLLFRPPDTIRRTYCIKAPQNQRSSKKLPLYTINMLLMTMYGFGHLMSLIPDHTERDWSLCFFQNQAIFDSLTFV